MKPWNELRGFSSSRVLKEPTEFHIADASASLRKGRLLSLVPAGVVMIDNIRMLWAVVVANL